VDNFRKTLKRCGKLSIGLVKCLTFEIANRESQFGMILAKRYKSD
jgi:hypothetical protein